MSYETPMGQIIQIDEARIRDHLGEMVRGTVEETLNAAGCRSGSAMQCTAL
jgi:putative transposase